MRRGFLVVLALALGAGASVAPPSATAASPAIRVDVPHGARPERLTAITLTLPSGTAAVDGRILVPSGDAELMGVAPRGGGRGIAPVAFQDGAWFGAYGLRASGAPVRIELVLLPHRAGPLSVRVIVDTVADRRGRRTALHADVGTRIAVAAHGEASAASVTPGVAGRAPVARATLAAAGGARPLDRGRAGAPVELVPDGRFNRRDVDAARLGWSRDREEGRVCRHPDGDADGDGCSDVADIQSTVARLGTATTTQAPPRMRRAPGRRLRARTPDAPRIAADGTRTWTVRSPADTPDADVGDQLCADSQGRCTLRAAMMEADMLPGDDRIAFDLPGTAPVRIQLSGRLPAITSRAGTLVIDGTTQPGARVNDARYGSNAVMGVELRGNGSEAHEVAFRVTSPGNTIRGLALQRLWRGVMVDGPDAADNRVVGNWIGFTRAGRPQAELGDMGVLLNVGARGNLVGGPDLADRNVIGRWYDAITLYGPGTDDNIVRNNLLCIRPGGGKARCYLGVDHNFGPKRNETGGDGPLDGNVTGPTYLQGVEYSHGWDPAGANTDDTWHIDGNRAVGNWIGFRMDGAYDPAYRPGTLNRINGQGINVYDGANDTVVEGNIVTSRYDGISVESKNSRRNIVRGNTIGRSPRGQKAPLPGWGIVVRGGTRDAIVEGNVIRSAVSGGIALTNLNAGFSAPQAPARAIRLSRNIVRGTSGPAIDLFGVPGPDRNDPGDRDDGANDVLNTPVVRSAAAGSVRGTGLVGATVEVYRASRAAGSVGLPVAFLGEVLVGADRHWVLPVGSLRAGDRVTALQIRGDGTTSELSANVRVAK